MKEQDFTVTRLRNNTLRASYILFTDKKNQQNSIRNTQIPSWLLSRYHDESYTAHIFLKQETNKNQQIWYQFIKKFEAINPESLLLLFWNIFITFAIILNFYQIPVSMFFTSSVYETQFNNVGFIIINITFVLALFINAIIVRPLTAYYSDGILITSRRLIVSRYVKLQFWLNSLAWLSLVIYISSNNSNFIYMKLLFYLNGFCLSHIDSLILQKLQYWKIRSAIYKLFRLIYLLLLFLFWIASIFFAIDYYLYRYKSDQYFPVNLWLTNTAACQYSDLSYINLLQTYDWPVWLNYSMYWALQTISTLGFGDVTARNQIQVLYVNILIMVFGIVYAYFLNSIWEILSELFENNMIFKSRIIKFYQRNYNLSKSMLIKLQNYVYETKKIKEIEQQEILIKENLSQQLKNQLILSRQEKYYNSIPFFNFCIDATDQYALFMEQLAVETKQCRYGDGQFIMKQVMDGQVFNLDVQKRFGKLCLLVVGEVELSIQNSKINSILKADINQNTNSYFGMNDLLCRSNISYTSKAIHYSKILQIGQKQFFSLLYRYPKIKQISAQLIQKIKIEKNHEISGEDCWVCKSRDHHVNSCVEYFEWLKEFRDIQQIIVKFEQKKTQKKNRQFRNRRSIRSLKIYPENCSIGGISRNKILHPQDMNMGNLSMGKRKYNKKLNIDKQLPQDKNVNLEYIIKDLMFLRNLNIIDKIEVFQYYRIRQNML